MVVPLNIHHLPFSPPASQRIALSELQTKSFVQRWTDYTIFLYHCHYIIWASHTYCYAAIIFFWPYFFILPAGLKKRHDCVGTSVVKNGVFMLFAVCDYYLFLSLGDSGDSIKMISEWIRNMDVAKSLWLDNADIYLKVGRENVSTTKISQILHRKTPAEDWDALENAPVGLVSFTVGIHAMPKTDHDGKIKKYPKNRKSLVEMLILPLFPTLWGKWWDRSQGWFYCLCWKHERNVTWLCLSVALG